MRGLTPERRELALNTLVGAVALTVGVLGTLWVLSAFIVGSVDIIRWIGELG